MSAPVIMVCIDYFDGVNICVASYLIPDQGNAWRNLSEGRFCWLDEFDASKFRYIKAYIPKQ